METLSLSFGGHSTPGVKEENQDALAAYQTAGSALTYKGAVASIADGLSSSSHAKEASTTCATMFIQDYLQTPESWGVERSAGTIFRSLNSWCFAQSSPEFEQQYHGSPNSSYYTTLSAVVFRSQSAFIFHVGDTRVYRFHQSSLELLTRDHKHRQGDRDYLSRAIGVDSHIDVDCSVSVMEKGDVFLLTTDGLHEFVSPQRLKQLMSMTHINLETKAKSLVDEALQNGSDDNVSCLLVKVNSVPNPNLTESYRELTRYAIPPVLEVGNTLDGYKVVEVLAEGMRSTVYKVLCKKTKKTYALKAPSPSFEDDLVYLRNFVQEQWIGQQLSHKNIMGVEPRNLESQFLYQICELIEGQNLRQWMIDHPHPSLSQLRSILKPMVSALRKFQRLDMVHRDLRPENIMINLNDQVKLVDFGTVLAASFKRLDSAIVEEVAQGSVDYAAPETVIRNECTHLSDLYSLGVISYELLANKLPYNAIENSSHPPQGLHEWEYQSISRHRTDLPPWVDVVLRKACHPNPSKRYQAYSEFLADLDQPNDELLASVNKAPLLEKDPLLFWKGLAALFFVLNVVQLIFHNA